MIIGSIRQKLTTAIEWRVIREVDRERAVILSLQEAVSQTGLQLTDRIATLEKVVEDLSKKIKEIESKSP
jgi:hypothetical protein